MRVLMVTAEYPTPEIPMSGVFVHRQVEHLRRVGVDVEVFPFRGAKNPFAYLRAWKGVRTRLRRSRFDLVHAQFGNSGVLCLPRSVPLVVTFMGGDVQGFVGKDGEYTYSGKVLQAVSRFVSRHADEIVVVSSRLGEQLPISRFTVIPSGLDLDAFQPMPREVAREQLGLPQDKPLVFFGGSPGRWVKRFALAEAAVEIASRKFGEVELVPAGDIAVERMPLYMNACDVLLLTSRHEGSPNVVKEALACNMPVVSVDVGDVRERIAAVEGCVLCEDDSAETVAAGLEQVLARGGRVAGRETVRELAEDRMVRRLTEVYRRASGANEPSE